MAESVKSSEKLSLTSSDLGSSVCDHDVDTSSDVKDKSDDVASVEGSASLTIDPLEEEGSKEKRSAEKSSETVAQSQISDVSNSNDSLYLHEQKVHSAIENCRENHKDSELDVHSEDRTGGTRSSESPTGNSGGKDLKTDDYSSVEKRKLKDEDSSEYKACKAEIEQTTAKREQTDVKSQPSTNHEDTRTASTELAQTRDNYPSGSKSTHSSTNSQEPHVTEEKLILRKSRSLTDESTTDPSPKLSRRSGIPRRKNSTQSMITDLSSSRSTPQGSPVRVRRSLTMDSAACLGLPAQNRGTAGSSNRTTPASFPPSPVKVANKLRRSVSQSECCATCVPCSPLALSRDNVTSRLRFEKHHQDHGQVDVPESYLTPLQRKELTVKELRAQVRQLIKQLEDKCQEIEDVKKQVEEEKVRIREDMEVELEDTRAMAEAARKEVSSLQESHTESIKTVATLQQQLEDVKKDMRSKLAESEEIFLEMYNKGRQSAIFEHEEEMELKQKGGRTQEATAKELYNKLVRTQAELAKWQTIQRHESYHTMPVPGTEAETTLRFLKDSVFHYLTKEKDASDEHLRAIVRILHFSEAQRERIAHALIMKRNKSGW